MPAPRSIDLALALALALAGCGAPAAPKPPPPPWQRVQPAGAPIGLLAYGDHIDQYAPDDRGAYVVRIEGDAAARAALAATLGATDDVAGFMYELRTLMNMLGMETQRRRSGTSDATRERRDADHRTKAAAEVFTAAPIPMAVVDVTGKVRIANQAFLEFLGCAGDVGGIDLRDSGMLEVYPGLLRDLAAATARRATVKRVVFLAEGGDGGDGGGATDPAVDCASVTGVQHTIVEEAKGGRPVAMQAAVGADVQPAKMVVMYRPRGATDFTEAKMTVTGECVYNGAIPADALSGDIVHYYIAAYNASGKLIASKGSAGH